VHPNQKPTLPEQQRRGFEVPLLEEQTRAGTEVEVEVAALDLE